MLVLLACLFTNLAAIYGLILEANYKPWDSTSTKFLYDYSLKLRHASIYSTVSYPIVSTDRGLLMKDKCEICLPTNSLASSPTTQDSVISMWVYFFTSGRVFLVRDTRYSTSIYRFDLVMDFSNTNSITLRYSRENQSYTNVIYDTPSNNLYGNRWRYIVARFQQEGNNTRITIYINTVELLQIVTNNFYINMPYNAWNINSGGSYFRGIIYEMWWHSGMTSISELDSTMTSSSFYITPHSLSVPSNDYIYNFDSQPCPNSCTDISLSCHTNFKCLGASESSCYYNFLQTTTNQCILNCPKSSCTCSTSNNSLTKIKTFVCNCNVGYNKINDNPIACIDSHCEKHTQDGYTYTCTKCEEGYTLDTDNSCKCDIGYVQKQTNPLKCAFDTFRCVSYIEGPSLYTCSHCEEGYIVGCSGKCCICDIEAGYIQVVSNPIECVVQIDNCSSYTNKGGNWVCGICNKGYEVDPYDKCLNCAVGYDLVSNYPFVCYPSIVGCAVYEYDTDNNEWICQVCSIGYTIGCNRRCCECDIAEGYIQISKYPTICIHEIAKCTEYKLYDAVRWGCKVCEVGYDIDIDLKCDKCQEGYIPLTEYLSICVLEIEHCSSYVKEGKHYICYTCEEEYILINGRCYECSSGYYPSNLQPQECVPCPSFCTKCKEFEHELVCSDCEYGYILVNSRCLCNLEDFYLQDTSCLLQTLSFSLSYDINIIKITFSKVLYSPLTLSDISLVFLEYIDTQLLSYDLVPINGRTYSILFNYEAKIYQEYHLIITFLETVVDRQMHGLIVSEENTRVILKFEENPNRGEYCSTSCMKCEVVSGRLECIECYDFAYLYEGMCRCYAEIEEYSSKECPNMCPYGMVINSELKTCVECEVCDEDVSIEEDKSTEESYLTMQYSDFSQQASTVATVSAIALGVGGQDKKSRFISEKL